jgi:hypothetical protein
MKRDNFVEAMQKYRLLLLLLLSFSYSFAQTHWQDSILIHLNNPSPQGKAWQVEITAFGGGIWKHTPKFKADYRGTDLGAECSILRQTFGSKAWHATYHFPRVGYTLIYNRFPNVKQLGYAYGILGTIQLPIYKGNRLQLHLGISDGLAWLTNKYEATIDSNRNAIGSHINEVTSLKLVLSYAFSPYASVKWSSGLTHFSNARFKTPNLGINIYTTGLSLNFALTNTPANFRPLRVGIVDKRWKKEMRIGFGRTEFTVPNGPNWDIYVLYGGLCKQWNSVHRFRVGLRGEYNTGAAWTSSFFFPESNKVLSDASTLALQVGEEWLIGKFGILANVGYYLHQGLDPHMAFYQQLGINYLLWRSAVSGNELYTGVLMKNHLGVAQYPEGTIGWRF